MPRALARSFKATIPPPTGRACRSIWSPSGNSRSLMTSMRSKAVSDLSGAFPWRSSLRLDTGPTSHHSLGMVFLGVESLLDFTPLREADDLLVMVQVHALF